MQRMIRIAPGRWTAPPSRPAARMACAIAAQRTSYSSGCTTAYHADDAAFGDVPPIELVRFADLEPDWSAPGACEPGTMRWSVQWVCGPANPPGLNPGAAQRNSRVSVGMTMLEPGHRIPAASETATRFYLVLQGEAITGSAAGAAVLGRLDGLNIPAGEAVALRNNGPSSLRLLWVDYPAASDGQDKAQSP